MKYGLLFVLMVVGFTAQADDPKELAELTLAALVGYHVSSKDEEPTDVGIEVDQEKHEQLGKMLKQAFYTQPRPATKFPFPAQDSN